MRLHDPTHLYEGEMSPALDRISRFISVVTYAPILSAIMFVLLNITCGDAMMAACSTVVTLVTATILPIAIVQHYSVKYGNTDGDVYRREDRAKPLIGGILSYILGVVLLLLVGAPEISTVMMVSYTISTILVALISTRWKISIHATGVTGPAIALSITYPPWGYLVFLLIPFVMWSRYIRRKHTPAQLVGGVMFGIVCTCAVLWSLL